MNLDTVKTQWAGTIKSIQTPYVAKNGYGAATEDRIELNRLTSLIQKLRPIDKQVMLLYLEGLDAASIGEVSGLSPQNVATKIHRIIGTGGLRRSTCFCA